MSLNRLPLGAAWWRPVTAAFALAVFATGATAVDRSPASTLTVRIEQPDSALPAQVVELQAQAATVIEADTGFKLARVLPLAPVEAAWQRVRMAIAVSGDGPWDDVATDLAPRAGGNTWQVCATAGCRPVRPRSDERARLSQAAFRAARARFLRTSENPALREAIVRCGRVETFGDGPCYHYVSERQFRFERDGQTWQLTVRFAGGC